MALYHKWDVKNGFAFVLQFFSLISDDLVGVKKDTLYKNSIEDNSNNSKPNERIFLSEFSPKKS